MPHTGYEGKGEDIALERYAVVSCHVERVLDDPVWEAFRRFQARRPGGFRIAALLRPPDPASDEGGPGRDAVWRERAHAAAAHGPVGLHTHFGGREHGRPRPGDPVPADRVRDELGYLAEAGVAPRFFCGGNWYIDEPVARVLAAAGIADCTARDRAPAHLAAGAPHLTVAAPARLRLGDGATLLELPTTHSLGMTARAAATPSAPAALHCYFHDTDLLVPRRARALAAALAVLGRRRRALDLDQVAAAAAAAGVPELPYPG